jgi:FemAB-related protein (PEP-CTERM system-associated)
MTGPLASGLFTVRVADHLLPDMAEAIDRFVLAHEDGTPFHRTAWSVAVTQGCRQKCHYLIAQDGAGTIAGVLPLTEIKSRLFGHALASAGFAVGGGILAHSDIAARQLSDAAIALAESLGCPGIEMRGGPSPDGWNREEGTYLGFSRSLAPDDEAELLAIPRKQRAEVRKALGFDLSIDVGTGQADRKAHYQVYATSVRNLGTPVFPRKLFDAALDAFGEDADILTVRHEGRAIASVLSLYHNGVVMPYWGGGTDEARKWRANDLMYYALMLHARKKGCVAFDFGRSKVGTGPASFKKNWGFEPTPLSYAKWTANGQAPREINPLNPKYKLQVAIWKKLPLWAANRVGPILARGLG